MEEKEIFNKTHLLIRHGSHAYGLNIETSDVDEKGICILDDLDYYFGLKHFEQKDSGWEDGSDRVIWDIRKFFSLALKCNPNIIEVLYVHKDDILKSTPVGDLILENRDAFLSRKASKTFIGYAISQLRKIRAVETTPFTPESKQEVIKKTGKKAMHLIRLLRMGQEIVKDGQVNVRRPDREELLDIRMGRVPLPDVVAQAEEYIEEIDSLVVKSPLPEEPDYKTANNLLKSLLKAAISKKICPCGGGI